MPSYTRMKLQFTDDRVSFEIQLPDRSVPTRSFPFVLVPGRLPREGYTMFGYDPSGDYISVMSTALIYRTLVIEPHGTYSGKAKLDGIGLYDSNELSGTMEFKDINGERTINYHFALAGSGVSSEYNLLVKPTLLMQTPRLVQVELLEWDVSGIQSLFPGLSKDFFYKNLGYDPEKDIITLLLRNSKHITLVNVASATPTTPPSSMPTLRKPRGRYTRKSPPTSVQLEFLENDKLVFETPANRVVIGKKKHFPRHATVRVSSSLVRVLVSEAEARLLGETAPAGVHFKAESFTLLGYDSAKERITMIGRDGAYEFSADFNRESIVTRPSGVYKGQNGALSVTMRFLQSDESSLVYYDIQLGQRYAPGSRQITFSSGSPFAMLSSSIIDVDLSTSVLSDIHLTLPGVSTDHYYTNLGYDSVINVVTFVLGNSQGIDLVYQPSD
ncbi:hypothetical protein FOZ61_006923 [Perkinsus olseni]|uniref:Uncharacterized protein n=1 Tax=Perkinsus olseni TaxID=32597 RepID=A0A7J6LC06_PEROL|nr:hypothetical protein FOZ61_006923 [Perkinsus olseni]KAF4660126.1 hypothetical protein FOL46_006326 [Perkinsus olseni]